MTRTLQLAFIGLRAFALSCLLTSLLAEELAFDRDIRPILSENCFHCHGPDANARKGDLRLDTQEGAFADLGGYAAVVPGDPERSRLITRIRHHDSEELMPPPDSNRFLKAEEIELLRNWIEQGAPWAKHWAFTPPQRAGIPADIHPIDHFVRARLIEEGLSPSPAADRGTLLRRITLDLTGLPPTPEELSSFLDDHSPESFEKTVDRLLASKRYGERMAWEWLDAARYADTNGFQGDPERTMWPWRDWVIQALNDNMPFDQFTIEQLAGDLLPDPTREQLIATAFNRNHMHNGEGGRIAEETRVENVFDRVETTSTIWLGLTMSCTRCHDHKYDALTMRDYYGLYDIFNQTSEDGGLGGRGQIPPVLDLSTSEEKEHAAAARRLLEKASEEVRAYEVEKFPRPDGAPLAKSAANDLPRNISSILVRNDPLKRPSQQINTLATYFRESDSDYHEVLSRQLVAARQSEGSARKRIKVMVMDTIADPRDTHILIKGSYRDKTEEKVTGALPAELASAPKESRRLNRLDLARWLVSPDNPLAARVTVNRAWQQFFGNGLVKTTEDFGVQASPPSHPALLDWLATEFMESGWDLKALHKLIVTSATYRQQSQIEEPLLERDPENRLLARGPRYRMPSWMLRDQALASSGLLVERLGGPSVKPYQPDGVWREATFGKKVYQRDQGDALYRRSLYTYWRRIVGPTMFFDVSNRNVCSVKSSLTNTPLSALTLLNETTYVEAARALAQRILHERPSASPAARINLAYLLTLGRPAREAETAILGKRLEILAEDFTANPQAAGELLSVGESQRDEGLDPIEHASYTALLTLILNLDESLTKQ